LIYILLFNGSSQLHKLQNVELASGSSVSIVTCLRAGWPGFDSRQGQGRDHFSSPPRPYWFWDPTRLLSNGQWGIYSSRESR